MQLGKEVAGRSYPESRKPQGSTSATMLGIGSVCYRERQGSSQRRRLTERGRERKAVLYLLRRA